MTLAELRQLHNRIKPFLYKAKEGVTKWHEQDIEDAAALWEELEEVDLDDFYDQDDMDQERTEAQSSDRDLPMSTTTALVRSGACSYNEASTMTFEGLCEFIEDELS